MNTLQLVLLLVLSAVTLYLLNCFVSHKFIKINLKHALCFVVICSILGVIGEVTIDSLYNLIAGSPLWVYEVLPVRSGYTSIYSFFIWGTMGFQLYLLHEKLTFNKQSLFHKLAIIFFLEAIMLEALFNLLSLALFGSYVYYYLPNNLWHITAFQSFPFYLLASYAIIYTLSKVKLKPYQFGLVVSSLAVVLILVV